MKQAINRKRLVAFGLSMIVKEVDLMPSEKLEKLRQEPSVSYCAKYAKKSVQAKFEFDFL